MSFHKIDCSVSFVNCWILQHLSFPSQFFDFPEIIILYFGGSCIDHMSIKLVLIILSIQTIFNLIVYKDTSRKVISF
jgi:hypothetical protein